MDWSVKVTDLAIIVATLLGPVFAVQAQVWLERGRELQRRRMRVFFTLMAEGRSISGAHIDALNAVPLEFADRKAPQIDEIRTAWKVYINHTWKDVAQPSWEQDRQRLYNDLLIKMGKFLGYKLDSVELEMEHYSPTGKVRAASDEETIRQQLARILKGEAAMPMAVQSMPADPEMVALWRGALSKLDQWLEKQNGGPVRPRT